MRTIVHSQIENPNRPQLMVRIRVKTGTDDITAEQPQKTVATLALLDTGASKTAVCLDVLNKVCAEAWSLTKVRTANGEVERYLRYVSLALLDDDGVEFATFEDIEVVEYQTFADEECKVLLGLDVLGKFEAVQFRGFEIAFELNGVG